MFSTPIVMSSVWQQRCFLQGVVGSLDLSQGIDRVVT
ncbi:hypothetical protein DBR06_SOUSAS29810033, partial [Sousa chinensis]